MIKKYDWNIFKYSTFKRNNKPEFLEYGVATLRNWLLAFRDHYGVSICQEPTYPVTETANTQLRKPQIP